MLSEKYKCGLYGDGNFLESSLDNGHFITGMTNRQLKTMLIYEGLFYAMSSVAAAFMLSLVVGPLAGKMLDSMFWFFELLESGEKGRSRVG